MKVSPGDLVEAMGVTHGGVILWPDFKYVEVDGKENLKPRVYLSGEAGRRLDGAGLVVAVFEWPHVVDSRIVLILFDNHLGYNREMFLRLVE